MTRSITPITAAGKDGDADNRTGEKASPEHGLAVLRGKEGRGLISLACDALGETFDLAHEMHARLYAKDPADDRELQQLMGEAQACLETAEHYLLMLGSVIDERTTRSGRAPDPDADPWSVEPVLTGPITPEPPAQEGDEITDASIRKRR
jgi:hypothetical protein